MPVKTQQINKTSKYVGLFIDLPDYITRDERLSSNAFSDFKPFILMLIKKYGNKYTKYYGSGASYWTFFIKKVPIEKSDLFAEELNKYYADKLKTINF